MGQCILMKLDLNSCGHIKQLVSSDEQAKSAQVDLEFDGFRPLRLELTWADLEKTSSDGNF